MKNNILFILFVSTICVGTFILKPLQAYYYNYNQNTQPQQYNNNNSFQRMTENRDLRTTSWVEKAVQEENERRQNNQPHTYHHSGGAWSQDNGQGTIRHSDGTWTQY